MRNQSIGVVLASVCALAGCNKAKDEGKQQPPASPTPVVVIDAGRPPIDAIAIDAPPPPLTPAIPAGKVGLQVIDLEFGGIVAPSLPAIKGDGSEVVVIALASDGGRGYLDLAASFLDGKTSAVIRKIQIADPEATSKGDGDPELGKTPARKAVDAATIAKVAELNAALATGDWRPLKGSARIPYSDATDDNNGIVFGELTYKLEVAKRVLTIARAGKVVGTHKLGKLYGVPGKTDPDQECGDDLPFLAAVFTDDAAAKAVIQVAFNAGGHNCGAGGEVYAVLPLPK